MKKKTGIIVSVIVATIVLIMSGVLGFLYFMTDVFKSNQQLFWEYASNSSQLVKIISSENEVNQKEWKENHSYNSKGDLSIAVTKENGTQNIKLGTTEKHSQNTGRTYSDITLYNGEAELLKTSYINSEDIHALYCKEIYEPYYIGFRNSDLKEVASKIGIDEEITQMLPLENTNGFTKEEMLHLLETYSRILPASIPEEKFAKTDKTTIQINNKNYEAVGYRLQLNQEEIRQILIDILNKTKEDEQIINILNKLINTENSDMESVIEQVITTLQEESLEEMSLTITVYNIEKKLTQIQINCNEKIEMLLDIDESQENKKKVAIKINSLTDENTGMQISMEQQKLENMLLYTIQIRDNTDEYQITMNTSLGDINDGKIENNSKITIVENQATIETSYYQTIQEETEEVDVQELTDSSAVIINNYPKEQLSNFFQGLERKTESVIEEKIGQLNIQMTDDKDSLYYIEGIVASVFAVMNVSGMPQPVSTIGMTALAGVKQVTQTVQDNMKSSMGNTMTSLVEQEKQIFNQKFEMYKGEEINGTLVRTLLSNIITSNTSYAEDNDRIIKVRLDGNKIKTPENWNKQGESDTTKLSQLRNNIKAGNKYNVVIEYNTKGFVEIITITEV